MVLRVKQCGSCKEIMPLSEKICYCDGPVKIIKADENMYRQSKSYYERRAMYFLRGKPC